MESLTFPLAKCECGGHFLLVKTGKQRFEDGVKEYFSWRCCHCEKLITSKKKKDDTI
ncbi:MAG: hypothetical protein KJ906_02360 [Nanoarchaeota archaeon]|nr:hypothetical protein [Nanoarchaeota archaeon]